MKLLKLFSFIAFCAATLCGCSKDEIEYSTEVTFKEGNGTYECEAVGGKQNISFFSQCGHWEISLSEGASEWLDAWPLFGDDNGRTTLTVNELKSAYSRTATLSITTDRGVVGKIVVKQNGAEPYIKLDLQSNILRVDYLGTPVVVNLTSNLRWSCAVLPDEQGQTPDWVTLGTTTEGSQQFLFGDNTGKPKRECTVRFSMIDGSYTYDLPVSQRAGDNTYERAEVISIADLLAQVTLDDSGSFEVEDNYAVQAWVTSDYTARNMPDSVLYLQDNSGRGLRLLLKDKTEFITPPAERAGWYDRGSKIAVHVYGLEFRKDAAGNLSVTDFPAVAVKEKKDDPAGDLSVARPDFSNLGDYANTLVRIDPVEFVFPYGCYTNYFESLSIADIAKLWDSGKTITSRYRSAFCDFRLYPQYVRDGRGQVVKLMFSNDFTQALSKNLPQGKGALTGIVTIFRGEPILQLRDSGDDAVAATGDRISRTLLKAGPWRDNTRTVAEFAVGNSDGDQSRIIFSLKNNETDDVKTSGTSGMYWLNAPFRYDYNMPWNSKDADRYLALNAMLWWGGAGSRLSTAADGGEGFILRTNTLRNASGSLWLSFSTASSKGGPGSLKLQWAETDKEDLTGVVFKDIASYDSPVIDYTAYQLPHCVKLPDEMRGKSHVVIVFRCADAKDSAVRADKPAQVSTTGTSRLGSIEIVEIK